MTMLGNSSQQALIAFLKTIGIDINLVSYPAHSTVEEGRSFRGAMPWTFTKNLFLKDKKRETRTKARLRSSTPSRHRHCLCIQIPMAVLQQ
jgi:hypothetical protein